MRPFFSTLILLAATSLACAQTKDGPDKTPVPVKPDIIKPGDYAKYGRGYKAPADLDAKIKASWAKHGHRMMALPTVTAPKWDCRDLGLVGPVRDQGPCGSCWCVADCGVLDSAFIKAGHFKNDGSITISAQYILDQCGPRNGGCNGDIGETVAKWARDHGIPSTQDYGPYTAREGRCKATNPKLWKIDSYGYVGSSSGVPATQAIKDAIAMYGPVDCAVDAGGFNNYHGGIMQGDGRQVDHEVSIIGWDDSKGTGCWLVKNQWGTSWGEGGYAWIPYGRWSIGYAALWAHATPVEPPTPTPPVPPAPGNFVPPFFAFHASSILGPYADLPAATAAGQAAANACQCTVTVKDSKNATAATLTPGTPPAPSGDKIVVTKPGTYVLVTPATEQALRDSGLSLDEYVAAAEVVRRAFQRPTAEPPCCNPAP